MGRTVYVNNDPGGEGWDPAWSQLTGRRATQADIVKRWDGLRVIDNKYENKEDPRPDPDLIDFSDPTPVLDPLPRPYGDYHPVYPFVDHDRDHHVIAVTSANPLVEVLNPDNIVALAVGDVNGIVAQDDIAEHEYETGHHHNPITLTVPAYTGGSYLYMLASSPSTITRIDMGLGTDASGAWQALNNAAGNAVKQAVRTKYGGLNSNVDFQVLRTNNELRDVFSGSSITIGVNQS